MNRSGQGSRVHAGRSGRWRARTGAGCALMIVMAVAGCGTVQAPAPAGQSGQAGSSAPAASTQPAAVSSTSPPSVAAQPGAAQPAGGPVPSGFAALSVTFVSPDESFVLGTAPCAAAPCTSIVRTLDRGLHWRGLPAPVVRVGSPAQGRSPAVWGIRFATPAHGFVFGTGLWETTDGGEHWTRDPQPGKAILSLAILRGQVVALTDRCTPRSGCGRTGTLLRRPLAGGSWSTVATVHTAAFPDPTDLIATQAGAGALLDGTKVLTTGNGGITTSERPTPCTRQGVAYPASVAVTSAHGLALLCIGQGYTSHTSKRVYVSSDGGASWAKAGVPGSAGDGGTITAATPATMVIATASAASWLYRSADSAAAWRTVRFEPDGGMGWADLGFTTTTQGVVVRGPAITDGNPDHRPGQLLLTSDTGATWHRVRF